MADIKEELKNEKNSKRRRVYRLGAYASIALLPLGAPNMEKYLISSDDKEKEPVENVVGYTRVVDYQVDTIPEKVFSAAYFSSGSNSITENYVVGEDNTYNQSSGTVSHEVKHRDNHLSGLRYKPMNLEQYYKTCCHNEISANIVELLQVRQDYLNNPTEECLADLQKQNPNFEFYFEALKKGEIKAEHNSTKDFDKEMKFIALGVQKMWMEKYDYVYDGTHCDMVREHFARFDYEDLKPNDENYEAYRDFVYKIGGIDFGKYLDDIKCNNNNIRIADEKIQNEEHRDDVNEMIVPFAESFLNNFGSFEHAPIYAPMSLEQMTKLLYDKEKAVFIQGVIEVRNMWLSAKSDAEREAIAEKVKEKGQDAQEYYEALKEGKIKPKGGKLNKDEIEFINNITVLPLEYEGEALAFYKLYKNDAVPNNDAYGRERADILTFNGVDYSKDIKETNVKAYNPLIVLADDMIKNGESKASVKEILRTQVSGDDILYVKEDINSALSPLQQHNIARHKMFMQNIMRRNYFGNDEKFAKNFAENAKELSEELKNNPTLKLNWDLQEYAIAEDIAKESSSSIFVASDNDALYQKELAKVYTFNEHNLLENLSGNIEELLPKNCADYTVENVKEVSLVDRFKNKLGTIKDKVLEKFNPSYTKAEVDDKGYFGEPVYGEWSNEHKVSEVQYKEIYDFRSNILKDQRDYLALKEDCVASKMFDIKFDRKVDERVRTNYVEQIDENEQHNTKNNTFSIDFNILER